MPFIVKRSNGTVVKRGETIIHCNTLQEWTFIKVTNKGETVLARNPLGTYYMVLPLVFGLTIVATD